MREIWHDPQARLDYAFQWSDWLAGDTITAATVVATRDGVPDATVTVEAPSHDATTVTAWVSGGTVGTKVSLTAHITTAAGRQDDRTIPIYIRQR